MNCCCEAQLILLSEWWSDICRLFYSPQLIARCWKHVVHKDMTQRAHTRHHWRTGTCTGITINHQTRNSPPHCMTPLPRKHFLPPPPLPQWGGPISWNSLQQNLQGCYWLLSFFGFLQSKMLAALCLPISPSFHSLRPFLENKRMRGNLLLSAVSLSDVSEWAKWNNPQQGESTFPATTRQRVRKSHDCMLLSAAIVHLVMNAFITDQSVFPSAFVVVITQHWLPELLVSHMDEWLLHARHNMLHQCAMSTLSLHICGGTASFVLGQEAETSHCL